jgi:CBS domain containing-hemolysin-like protein
VSFWDLQLAIPLAIICVLGSAFCSGTEVALFSLRRVDREQLARSTSLVDRRIVKLLERPRRLIATVLIGNEAFNSVLAVITFREVQLYLHDTLGSIWAEAGVALAIVLPLIVLISEVTSKTLAAKAPLGWARFAVLPATLFMVLVTPIRLVVQLITTIALAPLGEAARMRPTHDLSEEEFRTLVDAGSAQGQVDARERRLIHRVFEFSDKNVGQVMTPRDRMFALSYDLPVQRLIRELASRGFSRVPIYQKSLDNIRGIVNAKDLVKVTAGQPLGRPLGELLHEPLFVPRTTPVKRLFLTFKQKHVHMAIVVSEYGKVLGIVTMDDLLAQIFGVLRDERAELQNSGANRQRSRTPANGAPSGDSGVPSEAPNLESVPVMKYDGSDFSQPVPLIDPPADSAPTTVPPVKLSGDDSVIGLDPPPLPRHHTQDDEVTPPAVDVTDLRRTLEEKP